MKMKLFFLILVLTYISSKNIPNVMNVLNDRNFTKYVTKRAHPDGCHYLVIFYIDDCPYCLEAIKNVEEGVIDNYKGYKDYFFGKVNCDKNLFLTLQFNIEALPYIVFFENGKMYTFNRYHDKYNFIDFIDGEKYPEDTFDIPPPITYKEFIKRTVEEIHLFIKEKVKKFLAQWELYIKWKRGYTILLIITVLLTIFSIEYFIINFLIKFLRAIKNLICRKKKEKVNEEMKEKIGNENEIINNADNKKVKKD